MPGRLSILVFDEGVGDAIFVEGNGRQMRRRLRIGGRLPPVAAVVDEGVGEAIYIGRGGGDAFGAAEEAVIGVEGGIGGVHRRRRPRRRSSLAPDHRKQRRRRRLRFFFI